MNPATPLDDVAQLILRERQCRDQGWWDQMAACFADGSYIDISWLQESGADFVRRSSEVTGRGDYAVHRLSPPTVRMLVDRAIAEVSFTIIFHVEIDGVPAYLALRALSQHRAQCGDGVWRIVRITSIYEGDSLTPSVASAQLKIDPKELLGYRSSYRCLAWYLNRKGYTIGADLLGDDRPESAADHHEAEGAWLAESALAPDQAALAPPAYLKR